MSGSTISGTIASTVTLGSASYPSPLTVAGTGDIAPSTYAAIGIYGPAGGGTLLNDGTVTGGAGSASSLAGGGGTGVYLLGDNTATNAGTISGGAGGTGLNLGGNGGVGVYLAAGATLSNQSTIAGGGGGQATGGSSATKGVGGIGVLLDGGTLANGGDIVGGNGYGGRGYGGSGALLLAGTLTNTGTITGGSGDIGGGGGGSTLFSQDANGVYLSAGAILVNAGTIIGGKGVIDGGSGIFVAAGGSLTIDGVVIGGGNGGRGVYLANGGSLSNTGTVSGGAGGIGIYLKNGGTLINAATITGGSVTTVAAAGAGGGGGAGVGLKGGGVLVNNASIAGGMGGPASNGYGGMGGTGVDLANGGTLTNNAFIAGGAGGYGANTGGNGGGGASLNSATAMNAGTITGGNGGNTGPDNFGGNGGYGVYLTGGATLTNSGSIGGGFAGYGYLGATGGAGVELASSSLGNTFFNSGIVTGGSGTDVAPGGGATLLAYIYGGSGVSVAAGDLLTNSGTITGGAGVYVAAGGAFTNLYIGHVTGGEGAAVAAGGTLVNTGTIVSGVGVYLAAGSTLTNAGAIGGGSYGGVTADAVLFAADGTLVVDPGATFAGKVVANSSAVDALYLASGSSSGTLSGIGTQYIGFGQITIGAAASWMLSGANTIAVGTTLTELGGASLVDTGTLVNDGAIVLDPSTMTAAGLIGTGFATIEAGSTLEVQGTIAGGETLAFGARGAYLHLDNPDGVAGSVTDFAVGETIDLTGIDPTSVGYAGGTLSFSGGSFALSLTGAGPVIASTSADGAAVSVLCFRAGTRILTPSGERAVQQLAVGDPVRTVLGEAAAPIIWMGRREVDCARHPMPRNVWPVRVAAGAFGPGRPHADLFLSPDHAIYVEGVLIPVKHLINGSSIAQVPVDRVTYYHLELPEHDVLLAEGLPAESYLDMRDGSNYANRSGPSRLYPDYAARMWEAFGCARLIVTGPELAAARALVESFVSLQGVA